MSVLIYMGKTILVAGLLFAYYGFFLRDKQFHRYNRIYLLFLPVLSFLLPAFHISMPGNKGNGMVELLNTITLVHWEEVFVVTGKTTGNHFSFSWLSLAWVGYGVVTLVLLLQFVFSLLPLLRKRSGQDLERISGLRICRADWITTPFSFLDTIYLDPVTSLETKEGRQIFQHEKFHASQKHSLDIIFLELITIFCWFNPFLYLVKKEIRVIHEFGADQYAASASSLHDYAELLLRQSVADKMSLVHPFFTQPIKRRIAMITKLRSTRVGYASRLMVLPLLLILSGAFMLKVKATNQRFNYGPTGRPAKGDTLTPKQVGEINPADISSMDVIKEKGIVLIKFKNGDSAAVKFSELKSNDSADKNTPQQHDIVFTQVEHPASYPGGTPAWEIYLNKNLIYPKVAIDKELQGTVVVQFIVDQKGVISDVKVIQAADESLNKEAVRMITNSGKWQPALQNGHVVKSYVKQPIHFLLDVQK